ncbi:MAG: outer membrane protein transport protein [Thermoanaerobaculia bacterium]|nr:outer membrane protein transport protein [Thermoanaerobaculia bacterium]
MRSSRFRILTIALVTLAIAPVGFAAGFSIFEQGAKATGMGGAFAATANDPSAMFYNVAGIAYQRETTAMLGGTLISFRNEFTGGDYEFPGPGTTEGFEDHLFTPPNAYMVIPVGENATFGIGQFTPFGLRTHWEDQDDFTGRFVAQDTNLKVFSLQPSFAWKTSDDRFAVGVGVEYRVSKVALERNIPAINPFTLQVADIGHVALTSDEINDDFGWNVGLMFRPSETWSVGVTYRAPITIDYEGEADFQQISTGNPQFDGLVAAGFPPDQKIKTSVDFPAIASFGIATTAIPTWTFEFDAVLMTWSEFETLVVDFENAATPDLVNEENWDDSWSYRFGANKQVNDMWQVRLGVVWDETPQPVENVGPLLPDSNRLGLSFGVGLKHGNWRIDLSELYLPFVDRDTLGQNQDNYNGVYETTANLLSMNIGYTF